VSFRFEPEAGEERAGLFFSFARRETFHIRGVPLAPRDLRHRRGRIGGTKHRAFGTCIGHFAAMASGSPQVIQDSSQPAQLSPGSEKSLGVASKSRQRGSSRARATQSAARAQSMSSRFSGVTSSDVAASSFSTPTWTAMVCCCSPCFSPKLTDNHPASSRQLTGRAFSGGMKLAPSIWTRPSAPGDISRAPQRSPARSISHDSPREHAAASIATRKHEESPNAVRMRPASGDPLNTAWAQRP